jgi:tRNA-intron endonuclease, archaea type
MKPEFMSEATPLEEISPVSAALTHEAVVVADSDRIAELEGSGYGSKEGKKLVLRDYEALYLLYAKKLELRDEEGKLVPFETLAELAQKRAEDSWTKFMIYRDLRSRGYVVREGFGFGTDLRVYERGDYPKKAAKYVVFALDEGIEKRMADLQQSVREMAKMGKEAIIAVLERRGEVIYYKVSKARF